MTLNIENPLSLGTALTTRTKQLVLGFENGAADLLGLVTPTTTAVALRLRHCRTW